MKNKKYVKNYNTYYPSIIHNNSMVNMKPSLNLSKEELKEIAEKQNKSIEEVINDYKHALKELEYSNKKLSKIIKD